MTTSTTPNTAVLPFGVFCRKANDSLVLWQRYRTHDEALQIVTALARVKCAAVIITDRDEAQS